MKRQNQFKITAKIKEALQEKKTFIYTTKLLPLQMKS